MASAELTGTDFQSSEPSFKVIYADYTLTRFVSGFNRKRHLIYSPAIIIMRLRITPLVGTFVQATS